MATLSIYTENGWFNVAKVEVKEENKETLNLFNHSQNLSMSNILMLLHGLGVIDINDALSKLKGEG